MKIGVNGVHNRLVNSVKLIREVFIYFKRPQGRLVSNVKLEGVSMSFKETSGEVSVFLPTFYVEVYTNIN
jgi:hypothetical protein